MNIRIITILIAGVVFTAGLVIGFGGYVFAGDPVPGLDITIEQIPGGRVSTQNYSSLLSNTKSIGQVRMEVGDILLRYGVGGADINKVTEALEGGGVYEAELKSFLTAVGMNEKDAQDILLEFDKIGISKGGELRTPTATTPQQPTARKGMFIKLGGLPGQQAAFKDSSIKSIQNLKAAESDDQLKGEVRHELQANRETLQKSAETLRQDLRENAQGLRDNFRKRSVREGTDKIEKLEIARIAVAHGKGLRMINRYRSAIARFDHILGRMESRVQKLEAQGADMSAVIPLVEEAKNTQVLNKAKLAELQAKYESLLTGQNPGGIAKEAREIAKELKIEIEKLHTLLDDIRQEAEALEQLKASPRH